MSELALIKEQTLSNIGDAIREKTSTTDLIMPKDMPAKIRSISSGGVDLKSLRNKQYSIITDQANMHGQYIKYQLNDGGIDTSYYKSIDNADHLYASNGLVDFVIELKPMEGYNVGSAKLHSDAGMFDDITMDRDNNYVNDYLIGGDIHITELTPGTKATRISFEDYMSDWYPDEFSNFTELTETTKNIITNPAIKAIGKYEGLDPTMNNMFQSCNQLTTIPKIAVDTSDVVSMNRMFGGCNKLEKIDLSGLNTSKVKEINSMFDGCDSLKSVDMSMFNTSLLESYDQTFNYCNNLEVLDLSGPFIIDMNRIHGDIIYRCPKLKYIIFNSENTELLTNSRFVNWFGLFGNTDTLTFLIPGDQAKLNSIKSQIDQGQYYTYHIEIDLISNYTITKPGDGTVDVKKNEIVSEWKETKQDEDFKYFHIPKDNTGLTNKIIKFKVSGSGKWGTTPVTFTDLELPVCVKYINEGIGIDIITTNLKMRDFADDCSTETQTAAPRLFGELKKTDYDDAHGFIFISESEGNPIDYAVYNITNTTDMILSRVKCRSGNESWPISGLASQVQLQTELTVTKVEYKVIEASDIKPTDYKLNFD